MSDQDQRCLSFEFFTEPGYGAYREYSDFYSNSVQYFEVQEAHSALRIHSDSIVETYLENPFAFNGTITRKHLEEALILNDFLYEYLSASKYIDIDLETDLWKLALDGSPKDCDDVWVIAQGISTLVYKTMKYSPGSTHAHTTAIQALRSGQGVCQDFAHVLIGALRSIKIPTRYVSGYLYEPAANRERRAEMASHAWCEVYLPGVGWRGLDATNGLVANDRYIKLAVGRDYSDTAPLKGAYRGSPSQQLEVSVKIDLVNAGAPLSTT